MLIVITGPTAVGKTKRSIELAHEMNGEIISADSMQVYKHMDIGTAKIKKEEMEGVPHHLIDILEPTEEFNVFKFKELCNECIRDIESRGKTPIIAGGTGFYIQAVLKDVDFTEAETDFKYRAELEALAENEGAGALHRLLSEVDPEAAKEIHENNIKRTIRALEYYKLTGEKISVHNQTQRMKKSGIDYKYYVLNMDRRKLYERINLWVDLMREEGLIDEVSRIFEMGVTDGMTSMQGIGYKEFVEACRMKDESAPLSEIYSQLSGKDFDDIFEKIKIDTRHFAKRQLTWFRREEDVIWIEH